MATYTSNYAWTKPSGNDNVDISVLNANLDSQDSIIHDAFMNMAQAFSELSTYEVDDIVVYGTTTYKCHTAVTTAGSWTGSTNWQVYKLSEGGGGGLTLGETSSTAYRGDRGKAAYDHSQTTGNPHGTTKSDVGLSNVPNVATNDQTPTFTEASTRNNIASGEKLSVIMGKIAKFFNDLKTVAFSGSFSDLSNKPSINSVELSGNKTTGDLGINADNVMMSDGVTSVEDALDGLESISSDNITITGFVSSFAFQKIGRIVFVTYNGDANNLPTGALSFSETLPKKYRPAITLLTLHSIVMVGDERPVLLRFSSSGAITGYNYRPAISSATLCHFGTVSYLASN